MKDGRDTSGRLLSLDAFRGFDMLFIMGLGPFLLALCAAFGQPDCWLAVQLEHADWFGLTFEDLIFPTFLFVAGLSWPFSLAKQVERGDSRGRIAGRCLKRGLLLFACGLLYEDVLLGTFRFGSVLGRIGLAWMFAAWICLFFRRRTRIVLAVLLLVGYWALIRLVPAPDAQTIAMPPECAAYGRGPFSVVGNLSGWIDRTFVPGVLGGYPGVADNQSFLGVLPAVVTALLGMFAGDYVRNATASGDRKTVTMLAAAVALVLAGGLAAHAFGGFSMPFCKKLWSSSFVLAAGGLSLAGFAVFYWLIDVRKWWRRTLLLRVVGLNAITIYLAQHFIPFGLVSERVFGGLAACLPPSAAPAVLSFGYLVLCWLFLYFLYRQKIFLKV